MLVRHLKKIHYSTNYPQYVFYQTVRDAMAQLNLTEGRKLKAADLPCGQGEFAYNIAAGKNIELEAYDISDGHIHRAQKYFQQKNITFKKSDVIEALAGKYAFYDFIFIVNSLFLISEYESFLNACHTSLKQDGYLFVIIPNTTSPNFKQFQSLEPGTNLLTKTKEESISYISSLNFKYLSSVAMVYTPFYGRKELRMLGPFSNIYLLFLNKISSYLKGSQPSYHLLIFTKQE